MRFVIAGMFALVLLGEADAVLFRADIIMQQRIGREEREDISFINRTLQSTTGIRALHTRKASDNQKVILVLNITDHCGWQSFTSTLSTRGFLISTAPLQRCEEYARELNVTVRYTPSSVMQEYDVLEFFEVTIYDKGVKYEDYMDYLKTHFEIDQNISATDKALKSSCYQYLGKIPVTTHPELCPINRLELFNGTHINSTTHAHYRYIMGVEGFIPEEEYEYMMKHIADKHVTPTVFPGYNNNSEFFPFWSSEAYTYVIPLLGIAKYLASTLY